MTRVRSSTTALLVGAFVVLSTLIAAGHLPAQTPQGRGPVTGEVLSPLVTADEATTRSTSPTPQRDALKCPPALAELAQAFDKQWEEYLTAERQSRHDPLNVFGDRLVALARDDPSTDVSFFAACFLVRWGHGAPGDEHHRFLTAGMREILRRHKDNPHLTADLDIVGGGGTPELEIESFYRDLLRESENPTVRAGVTYALARHLDDLAWVKVHVDQLSHVEALREHLANRDVRELRGESQKLARSVIEEYPDERPSVRDGGWNHLDSGFVPRSDGPTYGVDAESFLFAVTHLREGCQGRYRGDSGQRSEVARISEDLSFG